MLLRCRFGLDIDLDLDFDLVERPA